MVHPVRVYEQVTKAQFEAEILPSNRPAVLRGLVADWPVVKLAQTSPEALCGYLKQHDTGKPAQALVLEAAHRGKFYYTPDFSGLNFRKVDTTLSAALDWLLAHTDHSPRDGQCDAHVLQALIAPDYCPPFAAEHQTGLLDPRLGARFWIGNAAHTQTHYDIMDNIACNVSGTRTFTLFPPEQLPNLYTGPFDLTPNGTPISLPDVAAPDLETYPRFAAALAAAEQAVLQPGDALYIPYFWWHDVRAEGPFNMLVNYWWRPGRPDLAPPYPAFYMALGAFAHMTPDMRASWKTMFDHFIFRVNGEPFAHLPEARRGIFGPMPPERMPHLHAFIFNALGMRKRP